MIPMSTYDEVLGRFSTWLGGFYRNQEFYLYSRDRLAEDGTSIMHMVREPISRHDGGDPTELSPERLSRAVMIGGLSDGIRLYLDPDDGMSLWQLWLDEGSVGFLAPSFTEFFAEIEDLEYE